MLLAPARAVDPTDCMASARVRHKTRRIEKRPDIWAGWEALKHSPVLSALPQTSWGVPGSARMMDAQKADSLELLLIAAEREKR